jgi:hypothetical protein
MNWTFINPRVGLIMLWWCLGSVFSAGFIKASYRFRYAVRLEWDQHSVWPSLSPTHHLTMKMHTKKLLIGMVAIIAIASCSAWAWQSWNASEKRRLDTAYAGLFPQPPLGVKNRYHSKIEAFTDTVERYRFDGGNQLLVKQLIQRFQLTPAEAPFQSSDPAPSWWAIPEKADIYTRGNDQQYFMLVFEPGSHRVFFERTQN